MAQAAHGRGAPSGTEVHDTGACQAGASPPSCKMVLVVEADYCCGGSFNMVSAWGMKKGFNYLGTGHQNSQHVLCNMLCYLLN